MLIEHTGLHCTVDHIDHQMTNWTCLILSEYDWYDDYDMYDNANLDDDNMNDDNDHDDVDDNNMND